LTGNADFPGFLCVVLDGDCLPYFGNNRVHYTIRGVHARLEVRWEFQGADGAKDTERALFRGSRAAIEVRQDRAGALPPEVWVRPNGAAEAGPVAEALRRRVARLQPEFAGLGLEEADGALRLTIPNRLRVGHEEHFELLVRQFLEYVRAPRTLPAWEQPNLLAKYFVTTEGVRMARQSAPGP
jgi:hypothetical protein